MIAPPLKCQIARAADGRQRQARLLREFTHSVSGGPIQFMGPITQSLAGEGGVSNARFIKRSGDWIMITTAEREH